MPTTAELDAWEDCCRAWLAAQTNPGTQRAYTGDLAAFRAWCPVSLAEVTAQQALAWWQHMIERGLRPSTAQRRLGALRSLYAYAERYLAPAGGPLRRGRNPFTTRWGTPLGDAIRAEQLRRRPPADEPPHDPYSDAIRAILPPGLRTASPTEEVR